MHGLGNDFVVVDARDEGFSPSEGVVRALADRHTGVGFDQLITLECATRPEADVFMRIHNADGGEVAACGNATRCVARLLADQSGAMESVIETASGLLHATVQPASGDIAVDMGPARYDWRDIPLAAQMDTAELPLARGPLRAPVAINLGNPHAVFFVEDADAIDLATLGPTLEHDPIFPQWANIGVAHVEARSHLRVRVWERGAGLIRACGTGACAAAVAAIRRDLVNRQMSVRLDGGKLAIVWRPDGHVIMTGPVGLSFRGRLQIQAGRS